MQQKLQKRLGQLQQEFEKGQCRLQELETETTNLKQTLLRISGAIQVLQEVLENENGQPVVSEVTENHLMQEDQ